MHLNLSLSLNYLYSQQARKSIKTKLYLYTKYNIVNIISGIKIEVDMCTMYIPTYRSKNKKLIKRLANKNIVTIKLKKKQQKHEIKIKNIL